MKNEMLKNTNAFATLPIELLVEIFSHLSQAELKAIKRVCRHWQTTINVYYSLHPKFISMQHWHDANILTIINDLEHFRNAYTDINYRNVLFRGRFQHTFSVSLTLFMGVLTFCMLTFSLFREDNGENREMEQWLQNRGLNWLNRLLENTLLIQISVLVAHILTFTTGLIFLMNREQNAYRMRIVTPESLDKLKIIYNKRQFFVNELPDSAIKQLFFSPSTSCSCNTTH